MSKTAEEIIRDIIAGYRISQKVFNPYFEHDEYDERDVKLLMTDAINQAVKQERERVKELELAIKTYRSGIKSILSKPSGQSSFDEGRNSAYKMALKLFDETIKPDQ